MSETDEPATGSDKPLDIHCPWCPYTDVVLKKVMRHTEAAHHQRWCDPALYPPIAGTVV